MALTETHWKLACVVSALLPAATLATYATHESDGPSCKFLTAADSGPQPGFSMLTERAGPVCTRVELPPLGN